MFIKSNKKYSKEIKLWDKSIKYHIATCYIDRSLSQNIHNITISAKIWRLKKAIILLKTDKSSDVLWINPNDKHAYFIKDIGTLENFLKNCIASGFNSSASGKVDVTLRLPLNF